MPRRVAAADVVPDDVQPQPLVRVEQQVGDPRALRLLPPADDVPEPAQGASPAVGNLVLRRGIDAHVLLPTGGDGPGQQDAGEQNRRLPPHRAACRCRFLHAILRTGPPGARVA